MVVAAYQAPLLAVGSLDALALMGEPRRACEAAGVDILCYSEAVLGRADDHGRPSDLAIDVPSGRLQSLLVPVASSTVTTIVALHHHPVRFVGSCA